jgi:hypothetical protein
VLRAGEPPGDARLKVKASGKVSAATNTIITQVGRFNLERHTALPTM